MRVAVTLLALGLTLVSAAPEKAVSRIIGGTPAQISQYPQIACLLFSTDGVNFRQNCGGAIINQRSILTAAHCTEATAANRWRARLGSVFTSTGGTVYNIASYVNHAQYNVGFIFDNDIAIMRTATNIVYVNNAIVPGNFAGQYVIPDNSAVWAAGWGFTEETGDPSEELLHVELRTVNQAVCAERYARVWVTITERMMCSGWLDVGGRDQCTQDSGGPLYHNGVVVGVCSFGSGCARPEYPGVNVRVSAFTDWIVANA